MRILFAGASGVIGRRLLPRLLAAGHEVTCLSRSEERATPMRQAGAQAIVADVLDARAVLAVAERARPEAVIHQLTSIPAQVHPRKIARQLAANDHLRVVGTRNLVAAAQAVGARRVIAQSIAFAYAPEGAMVQDERASLYLGAPGRGFRRMVEAIASLELTTLGASGVVLRYGAFYGPGTVFDRDGYFRDQVQRWRIPIVGGGTAVHSFIHVDDAASATVAALDAPAGIYHVVDDDPAPVHEWLPWYAQALAARRPARVPRWLGWLGAGRYGVYMMTQQRGASNRKARDVLGWTPASPTWRGGLAAG